MENNDNYTVTVTQACVDDDSKKRDTSGGNYKLHVCTKIVANELKRSVNFHARITLNGNHHGSALGVTERHQLTTLQSMSINLPSGTDYSTLHNNSEISLQILVAGNVLYDEPFTNVNLVDGEPVNPCSET